ncbi:general secretion pathway protein GspD [Pseudoduganella sp. FT55W]|uniref:General secretion pathway protein GspD n=1 Tax=Duganella rivi TaxID=2666083 RepID=A0A7X4KB31_9BURK|nr:cohesin domain-containing protein [Duganella rivi]MYM67701.1 general secretion pathway protein GspD [Duganella rivi]
MRFSVFGRARRLAFTFIFIALAGCAAEKHHRAGISALDSRDYPTAVSELAQAAQLKPGDLAYRRDWLRAREISNEKLLASALVALADGKRDVAERAYRDVLQYDRDNARALAGLERLAALVRADEDAEAAAAALKADDMMKAQEFTARALKAAPSHAGALLVRREIEAIQAQELLIEPLLGAIYKKPINLEFRDASIKFVFDALSRTTGINFIFDRDVKTDQRTTVFLRQTTLDDAISVMLSTGQLEKKVLNASSVLIYPNTPAKVREYQDLLVRAFYMANVEAKQAASMLKTVLKLKDVYVDDKYNFLILRESPETIALAEKLIRLQDLEEPEVMLEVEVLEINRSSLLNAGIQWSNQLTVTPLGGTTTGNGNGNTASTSTMKLSDLKNITSDGLGITVPSATINLQKTNGDANLLANPRIRVRDRDKAKVMIGDKVPVVTTTSTNNFVTENIQYLDVGLKLEVEPDVHLRDEIGLKLSLEVSSLVSSVKTNNGSQAYQIGTRNFTTALRLKDGETQVMAGLISDEDRSAANKIPLIGELPVLGRLFGSQSDTRQKTEIVMSITPHLIRNIQRKEATAESFWSGTEATLRNRPLLLRTLEAKPGDKAAPITPAGVAPPKAAPQPSAPGAPSLKWEGIEKARVGQEMTLYLNLDSADAVRAASLQLGYNPAEFEIISVEDGGYFGKAGQTAFSKSIDAAGGRTSASINGGDAKAKGAGRLLAVTVKARSPTAGGDISLIATTLVGAEKAIRTPGLPLVHRVNVTP